MRQWTRIAAAILLGASGSGPASSGAAPDAQAAATPSDTAASAGPAGVQSVIYIGAQPIERGDPVYPLTALENRDEGAVQLSFAITAEGSVADALVEISSGNRHLDRAALEALRRWRYEPATRNGEPVQQSGLRTTILFQIVASPGRRRAISQRFTRELRELAALAESGQLDEALTRVDGLIETRALGKQYLNNFEWTRLWILKAALDTQAGAPAPEIVDSLRRALANPDALGTLELRRSLLENLLKHELELGEYGRALRTLAELDELVPADERPDWLLRLTGELTVLLHDPRPLPRAGRIPDVALAEDQLPFWSHQPLRRQFGIEDSAGLLESVDIRCTWHRWVSPWAPDHTWHLPEDWGACDVYVFGEPGTTFTLVEYPLT